MRLLNAPRVMMLAALFAVTTLGGLTTSGCAESECKFNSDCKGSGLCVEGTCQRQCFAPVDCPAELPVCSSGVCKAQGAGDAAIDASDASQSDVGDAGATDVTVAPDTATTDSTVPDTTVTPTDTGIANDTATSGTKRYLTSCASDAECASGKCSAGSPRFCTKTCAAFTDCADGQVCGGGLCRHDDTGQTTCDLATGSPCAEFCYGTPTSHHCTHACADAAECPAGYACSPVSGKKICVEIEKGCTNAAQCPSSLGFCTSGGLGCTAPCDTAADCPTRFVGFPAYTCVVQGTQKVCAPPVDIVGSDPMGTSPCATTGLNTCRSAACAADPLPSKCVQRCTARGGCPVGWACYPEEDLEPPAKVLLVCSANGTLGLGDACTKARDCQSGICQAPGYCTRLCVDGLCPDGMSCVAVPITASDGTTIALCTRP